MDLSARKQRFIKELETIDESLFEKLEIVLRANKKEEDWYLKEEKEEIEIGLNQADKNEFVSHEDVMNKFAKWH